MKILKDFWIRFNSTMVGIDAHGNEYYMSKNTKEYLKGRARMVIFKNKNEEPSSIPCEWYSWLHHMSNLLPTKSNFVKHDWQADRATNMTGTGSAYSPKKYQVNNYYQSWNPSNEVKKCNTVT